MLPNEAVELLQQPKLMKNRVPITNAKNNINEPSTLNEVNYELGRALPVRI